MNKISMILFLIIGLSAFSSCYRMPTEDDYCMIPSTNNPDITHQMQEGLPGVGY